MSKSRRGVLGAIQERNCPMAEGDTETLFELALFFGHDNWEDWDISPEEAEKAMEVVQIMAWTSHEVEYRAAVELLRQGFINRDALETEFADEVIRAARKMIPEDCKDNFEKFDHIVDALKLIQEEGSHEPVSAVAQNLEDDDGVPF